MPNYFRLSENKNYTLKKISEFNDLCFPIRKPHHFYDNYRFVQNPFAPIEKNFIYGVEKDGKYIAQMLTMPVPLSLNEKEIPAFWGQDYFVLEENRGEGIGKNLANDYLKKDYYIAVGFSEKSAVIHQKMGAKKIGYLDFYRKWSSPVMQLKFVVHRLLKVKAQPVHTYHFPDRVKQFKRMKTAAQLNLPQLNWNQNVVETIRNRAYFDWRFFYKPRRYFVYQSQEKLEGNPPYFVVKVHFYKGVNWLKIVDYRFDQSKIEQFHSILESAEQLRKDLNLFGILISSSQKISQEKLMENQFTRYKHEVVLTTYPFTHEVGEENGNDFAISFADSDMDMHNYLGRFNYGEE
ncbi:MAG TPA: hypothetical protein VL022_05825 [Moheibacter sp.]|nr:hypothetical protein [Moheibacter sp.]